MTTKRIDARGLSCPQPVVLVNQAVAEGNTDLEITVDNEVSRENVTRFLTKHDLKTDARQEGRDILIRAVKA